MIVFILIFFAMVIGAGIAAVAALSIYFKRRNKFLETNNKNQFDEPPPYRSLFAPDEAEIQALEREKQAKLEAARKETESKILFEKAEKVRAFERIWRGEPNKQNTTELLRLAAASESAEVFSQTAENVIQSLHHEQAGGLSKRDLADLLESHLRILPQQERFSGAIFWVKREIERLRRKSE